MTEAIRCDSRLSIALLALALSVGCGGESSTDAGVVPTDAGVVDSGAELRDAGPLDAGSGDAGLGDSGPAPTDAGPPRPLHCQGDALFIAELTPGVSITLVNPSSEPVAVDDAPHLFCSFPSYLNIRQGAAGVTIGPGESHAFPWPSSFSPSLDDGEVGLYVDGRFTRPESQIDFVCWGPPRSGGRKSVAEMDGDWVGDCLPMLSGGSIRRLAGTDGHSAESYDVTGGAAVVGCD